MKKRVPDYFTYAAIVAFTLLFLHLLTSYWSFFNMGSAGGNGMALLFPVLPLSLVLFGVAGFTADGVARRYGWRPGIRRAATVLVLFCTLVLLFLGETSRTKDYPLESGEPVDISDFFRSYLGRG